MIHLPGVIDTRFGQGVVLADPRAKVAAVRASGGGVAVRVTGLDAAGYMPVVALPFEGTLHVAPPSIRPAADGTIRLDAAAAERFLNYNGGNYTAKRTPYKLRWYAAAGAGHYTLAVHYQRLKSGAAMDAWVDGHATRVALAPGSTEASVQVQRDLVGHPYAMEVELTPVAPFHYGAELPVAVESVDIVPVAAVRQGNFDQPETSSFRRKSKSISFIAAANGPRLAPG